MKENKSSMRRSCKVIVGICVIMFMVLFYPQFANAAKPLNKSDFIWRLNGKNMIFIHPNEGSYDGKKEKWVYMKDPGTMELYYDWKTQPIYKNKINREYDALKEKFTYKKYNIVTARGIKVGSTYNQVIKKYGNKKIKKSNSKDAVKQDIANRYFLIDTSKWVYYTDYTYKKYTIRFYYTKNKKVTAMLVIHDIKKLDSLKKNPLNITFTAPEGKKVTTKNVCGTKVYVLPKGTKISFDRNSKDNWNFSFTLIRKDLKTNIGACLFASGDYKKNTLYDAAGIHQYVMKFDQKDYPYVSYCLDKNGKKIYYYEGDVIPESSDDEVTYQKAPKGSIWRLMIFPVDSKKYSIKQIYYTFE